MKKSFTIPVTTFIFVLFISGLCTAQDNGPYSFSLQQCIEYAYSHHSNVLNVQLDEKIAHARVKEILGAGLPQITASLDVNHFIEKPTALVLASNFGGPEGTLVPFQFNLRDNATAGINASQLIFDGSYIVGVKASQTFELLARKQTVRTKIETAIAVSKAYYGVLVGDARSGILNSNLDRLQKTYDDTKAMYAQGFVEKIDADRLELALNNLKTEKEKADRLMELSIYLLKFQMGMPQEAQLSLTDKLESLSPPDITALPDSMDFSGRIESEVFNTNINLQQLNIRRYKAGYLPSIVAYGGLGSTTNSEKFDLFQSDKRWYWNSIIGVKITLPIFDGLQRESRLTQERYAVQKLKNGLITMQQGFQLEYNSAKRNYSNVVASFQFQKKNSDLAKDIVRVTKIKYDQGIGSNLEVVDAETKLREANNNYFNAMYDAIIAKIDLDKAMGLIK